jgi:hypothetical protein
MGIDIYASWKGQSAAEQAERDESMFDIAAGQVGYLREAYHGSPYATRVLVPEAFGDDGAAIPAVVLRQRLDATIAAAIERQRTVYDCDPEHPRTQEVCDSFRQFVTLCERMEAKTGEPCHIEASW